MTDKDILFLQHLWFRLTGEAFSKQSLVQQLQKDGGIDITGLSYDDLMRLVEGTFSGDWHEVSFAFSEMLACYVAQQELGEELSDRQVVAWAAAVFAIADATAKDEADVESQLDKFLKGLLLIRLRLEESEVIYIGRRFFGS